MHPDRSFTSYCSGGMTLCGLVLYMVLHPLVLHSQYSHQIFQHLTAADGLSSNKVVEVLQDREGYYWIATQNGLNLYDGTNITVFRNHSTDSLSLPHDFCTALWEDPDGNIWVATYNGLARFHKREKIFERIALPAPLASTEPASRISDIISDGDSLVWIIGDGLWQYHLQNNHIVSFAPKPEDATSPSMFHFLRYAAYDSRLHGLWLACRDELNFYDLVSKKFYSQTYNPKQWKIFLVALSGPIALDRAGHLWFISQDEQGLCVFHPETNMLNMNLKKLNPGVMHLRSDASGHIWIFYWLGNAEKFIPEHHITDVDFFKRYHSHSILTPRCTDVCPDRLGQYWILSADGISIYNPAIQYYKLYPFDLSALGSTEDLVTVYSIAPSPSGNIWMGTGKGLYQMDLKTGQVTPGKLKSGKGGFLKLNERISLVDTDDQNLYVGNWDQLVCWNDQEVWCNVDVAPRIQDIQKDSENRLWVATWSDGLYRIDPNCGDKYVFVKRALPAHSLRTNALLTCVLDSNDLWLGYNGGHGFSRYDLRADSFEHFIPAPKGITAYGTGTITSIIPMPEECWLGTYGGGLLRYDRVTGEYNVFQQEHGLKSNYINCILPDAFRRLWISTADGLNVMDLESGQIQATNIELGFPGNDFYKNGHSGPSGKLYFFNFNKIVEIDPALFRFDTAYPAVVLSQFKIKEKASGLAVSGQSIDLSYQENFFSFSFSAIKNHPGIRTHYAYRLVGFDPEWIETTHPQAVYTNVPAGKYQFEVRVMNDAGLWSPVAWSRSLQVYPPFWQTWWFIGLITIFIGSVLYGLHRYRIQQIRKIYNIRSQISRDLHDDIGASLSSIHIYGTIAEEEIEQDPVKAKAFLHQINTNSRQVMEDISDIVWANRLQHDHHASLEARIKNYGYELLSQKNIACIYRIDPQTELEVIRPEARRNILMIIKEAMNNMAKYSDASLAEIDIRLNGRDMVLNIRDNGRGFVPEQQMNGNGLVHMRKRAESMAGTLSITSSPGEGTQLECRIPITNISDT